MSFIAGHRNFLVMQGGRKIATDDSAETSDSSLPAFLSKPPGAPVYHGFPLVPESLTEGWVFGAITEYAESDGCDSGDAFVQAPDGSRAGLVWDVGAGEPAEIAPPTEDRWGVYQVWFPKPVRNTADLVENFRSVLPKLRELHAKIFA